jgi:hypothetical protein
LVFFVIAGAIKDAENLKIGMAAELYLCSFLAEEIVVGKLCVHGVESVPPPPPHATMNDLLFIKSM